MHVYKYSLQHVIYAFKNLCDLSEIRIVYTILFITQFVCEVIRFHRIKSKIGFCYEKKNWTTLGDLVDGENYWADFGNLFSQVVLQERIIGLQMSNKIFDRITIIMEELGITYEEVEVEEKISSSTSAKKVETDDESKSKRSSNKRSRNKRSRISPSRKKKLSLLI